MILRRPAVVSLCSEVIMPCNVGRVRNPQAVDLFAGAGGATQGLKDAGFELVGAVELDSDAAASYRLNHPTVMLKECDLRSVSAAGFRRELGLKVGELDLLKACPPCQGFSTMAEGRVHEDAERNDLVLSVVRFVREFRPKSILIENVPGLQRDRRFNQLIEKFKSLGYSVQYFVVRADEFGVPQRRRRLIVVALRGVRRAKDLPKDLLVSNSPKSTVSDVFDSLRSRDLSDDALNVSRTLKLKTLARIKAVPVGGSRRDLPAEHQLDCHVRVDGSGRGATSSYGRMKLDEAAPTMTTRCTTPACGRFIHPTEDRGITLREAASIQTFPPQYKFVGGYGSIERQIGNAVPVQLASQIGEVVRSLLLN